MFEFLFDHLFELSEDLIRMVGFYVRHDKERHTLRFEDCFLNLREIPPSCVLMLCFMFVLFLSNVLRMLKCCLENKNHPPYLFNPPLSISNQALKALFSSADMHLQYRGESVLQIVRECDESREMLEDLQKESRKGLFAFYHGKRDGQDSGVAWLPNETIREILMLSRPSYTDEKIWREDVLKAEELWGRKRMQA